MKTTASSIKNKKKKQFDEGNRRSIGPPAFPSQLFYYSSQSQFFPLTLPVFIIDNCDFSYYNNSTLQKYILNKNFKKNKIKL